MTGTKKRLITFTGGCLVIILIVSLVLNYMHYRRVQREQEYVRSMYNQFIFEVDMAAEQLGKVNHSKADYLRTAVDTSEAATTLYTLDRYESSVEHPRTGKPTPPHLHQLAIFLSYLSLVFVKDNPQFSTQ